jgi:hypothetical protein
MVILNINSRKTVIDYFRYLMNRTILYIKWNLVVRGRRFYVPTVL